MKQMRLIVLSKTGKVASGFGLVGNLNVFRMFEFLHSYSKTIWTEFEIVWNY